MDVWNVRLIQTIELVDTGDCHNFYLLIIKSLYNKAQKVCLASSNLNLGVSINNECLYSKHSLGFLIKEAPYSVCRAHKVNKGRAPALPGWTCPTWAINPYFQRFASLWFRLLPKKKNNADLMWNAVFCTAQKEHFSTFPKDCRCQMPYYRSIFNHLLQHISVYFKEKDIFSTFAATTKDGYAFKSGLMSIKLVDTYSMFQSWLQKFKM